MLSVQTTVATVIVLSTLVFGQSASPIPLLNQPLVPGSVLPGSPGFVLTVNGTGFVPESVVKWNRVVLPTTFVSSSKLMADVPAANVASPNTASVEVFSPGPGGGLSNVLRFTISPPTVSLHFASSTINADLGPNGIAVADINNDGKDDLVVINRMVTLECGFDAASLSVFLGRGDGTFDEPQTLFFACAGMSFGSVGFALSVGDMDGDGNPDLLVSYETGNEDRVAIFLGNGDGTFHLSPTVLGADRIGALTLGDFDRDGKMDIALPLLSEGTAQVGVLFGNGAFVSIPPGDLNFGASGLATGDFDGDGNLDLGGVFFAQEIGNEAGFFPGNGDETFGTPRTVEWLGGRSSVVGDFNGDNNLDLIFGDTGPTTVLLGDGHGGFGQIGVPPPPPGSPSSILTADLNGDGKLDLIFSDTTYLGNGDGTFQPSIAIGLNASSVGVGDFNGDGRLDLALPNSSDNTITILFGVRSTTTTLTSSLNPSRYGQTIALKATVVSDGSGLPTGSVIFMDGTTALANVSLSNGVAALNINTLTAASHSLTASFSGEGLFGSSTSAVLTQAVAKSRPNILLTSSPNPAFVDQAVILTFAVSAIPAPPTGSVTFKRGPVILGTAPLTNGRVSFPTSFAKAGTLSIVGTYSGDQNFYPRNSKAVKQVVTKYTTTIALSTTPNPSVHGQPVTMTAIVTSTGAVPTGKVTFKNGSTSLGSTSLIDGVAKRTTTKLPVGTNSITAIYNGDAESAKSSSPPLLQVVN